MSDNKEPEQLTNDVEPLKIYLGNCRQVVAEVEKKYKKLLSRLKYFNPGHTNTISFNIVEFKLFGWCWTVWSNKCNMLCSAGSNCGDQGSGTKNDPEF